jgi:hypothetical protein
MYIFHVPDRPHETPLPPYGGVCLRCSFTILFYMTFNISTLFIPSLSLSFACIILSFTRLFVSFVLLLLFLCLACFPVPYYAPCAGCGAVLLPFPSPYYCHCAMPFIWLIQGCGGLSYVHSIALFIPSFLTDTFE